MGFPDYNRRSKGSLNNRSFCRLRLPVSRLAGKCNPGATLHGAPLSGTPHRLLSRSAGLLALQVFGIEGKFRFRPHAHRGRFRLPSFRSTFWGASVGVGSVGASASCTRPKGALKPDSKGASCPLSDTPKPPRERLSPSPEDLNTGSRGFVIRFQGVFTETSGSSTNRGPVGEVGSTSSVRGDHASDGRLYIQQLPGELSRR